MTHFITYRELDEDGKLKYFILQKEFPHYCAFIDTVPNTSSLAVATIAGYNLWVVFFGTLRGGGIIPSYKNVIDEVQGVLEVMGSWYLSNRINVEPKKYLKFKIVK